MPYYKNNSSSIKTFYGVEFKPGEVQSVPGYINSKGMFRVEGMPPKKLTKDESSPNALDVIAEKYPDIIEDLTPTRKRKPRSKKNKDLSDDVSDSLQKDSNLVESILSTNIEEGEEIDGTNSD